MTPCNFRRAHAALFCAVLGLSLAGCGEETAEDKCTRLIERLCDRQLECLIESNGSATESTRDECLEGYRPLCDAAVDLQSSFDRCYAEVGDARCDALLVSVFDETAMPMASLPSSCIDVILVEE